MKRAELIITMYVQRSNKERFRKRGHLHFSSELIFTKGSSKPSVVLTYDAEKAVEVSPWSSLEDFTMKPTAVADEMFPEGAGTYVDAEEGGGSVGLLMDLSAVNEKAVHDGFFNDFEDLFDDEDIA